MKLLSDQECHEGIKQICDLASHTAMTFGIKLQSVLVDNGNTLSCINKSHILQLTARGKTITVKISHDDVSGVSGLTDKKIHTAVDRLKVMLE